MKIQKTIPKKQLFLFTPSPCQKAPSALFPLPLGEGFRVRASERVGVRSQFDTLQ